MAPHSLTGLPIHLLSRRPYCTVSVRAVLQQGVSDITGPALTHLCANTIGKYVNQVSHIRLCCSPVQSQIIFVHSEPQSVFCLINNI